MGLTVSDVLKRCVGAMVPRETVQKEISTRGFCSRPPFDAAAFLDHEFLIHRLRS